MRVLIQLRPSPDLVAAVADPSVVATTSDVTDGLPGVVLDHSYTPVAVPRAMPSAPNGDPLSLNQPLHFSLSRDDASVVVRGEVADDEISTRVSLLPTTRGDVVAVYADPVIETTLTCGGDAPLGDWHDVERLLHVAELIAEGLDGGGVALAVADTGINALHVTKAMGRDITIDKGRSWRPVGVIGEPGAFEVDHGTMCAFDALIAAPRASLIDIPVLLSRRPGGSALDGLLSDAVAAYAHLRTVLEAQPADTRSLVEQQLGIVLTPMGLPARPPRQLLRQPGPPVQPDHRQPGAGGGGHLVRGGQLRRAMQGWPVRLSGPAHRRRQLPRAGAVHRRRRHQRGPCRLLLAGAGSAHRA